MQAETGLASGTSPSPGFPVFFSTHSSVLQSWTGISPYPTASQPCPELVVGLREDGIISLGLPSYDSCIKSAYSCGVRSKLLQNGLFHTCFGSAVALDSKRNNQVLEVFAPLLIEKSS